MNSKIFLRSCGLGRADLQFFIDQIKTIFCIVCTARTVLSSTKFKNQEDSFGVDKKNSSWCSK